MRNKINEFANHLFDQVMLALQKCHVLTKGVNTFLE